LTIVVMNRARWSVVAVVLIVAAVIGGYVAWDHILRGDNVAPLALSSPAPSSGAASSGPPASGSTLTTPGQAAGTWAINGSSVVGYRVREKLAALPAQSDAVGRTSAITGSVTLADSGSNLSVTTAQFEADLTRLTSDKNMRDNKLRTLGLESDTYPTSTFKLKAPVAVPATRLSGQTFDVTLNGDLTLHGVTRTVSIPAQARMTGGQIEVVGSLTFPMADYSIVPPSIGNFVTVTDQATLEFDVLLDRA
jgi:polyisoprenoid-binding protein YceI